MSEMVERVARMLCEAEHGPGMWEIQLPRLDQEFREKWRRLARAAIGAMREPTSAIMIAYFWSLRPVGDEDPDAAWRAMIDAAIKN